MSGRKTGLITAGWVLAVSLLVSALTAVMVSRCCSWSSFDLLNTICQAIVEQEPGTKKVVAAVLKEYVSGGTDRTAPLNFLSSLGYRKVFWRAFLFSWLPFSVEIERRQSASGLWRIIWSRSTRERQPFSAHPARMSSRSWRMKSTRP